MPFDPSHSSIQQVLDRTFKVNKEGFHTKGNVLEAEESLGVEVNMSY